jgi:hypothetical protein
MADWRELSRNDAVDPQIAQIFAEKNWDSAMRLAQLSVKPSISFRDRIHSLPQSASICAICGFLLHRFG